MAYRPTRRGNPFENVDQTSYFFRPNSTTQNIGTNRDNHGHDNQHFFSYGQQYLPYRDPSTYEHNSFQPLISNIDRQPLRISRYHNVQLPTHHHPVKNRQAQIPPYESDYNNDTDMDEAIARHLYDLEISPASPLPPRSSRNRRNNAVTPPHNTHYPNDTSIDFDTAATALRISTNQTLSFLNNFLSDFTTEIRSVKPYARQSTINTAWADKIQHSETTAIKLRTRTITNTKRAKQNQNKDQNYQDNNQPNEPTTTSRSQSHSPFQTILSTLHHRILDFQTSHIPPPHLSPTDTPDHARTRDKLQAYEASQSTYEKVMNSASEFVAGSIPALRKDFWAVSGGIALLEAIRDLLVAWEGTWKVGGERMREGDGSGDGNERDGWTGNRGYDEED